ncbi:phage tail tape measure protein [Hafnia paralvei]|uniref:phage tail tape measure protein n=1 Tax=Hafnia paralvei TaxID=546367 RepID=UPI000DF13F4A|nr:phage tail tape measure protein [Hafnia paralvei]RDA69878.1 phage tail tape measure protein [Hafnia paralvei]RDA70728.1 phage tail tape measure protein [Hafnia paralvei]RDA70954.1 phage tail tape measure protein [Hafnia paralvei]RDA80187.1 phage tail tape measure protein [Hafnia paralvei]RDA80533.1 phage tail tape measure protein [Hafnia paralvei]
MSDVASLAVALHLNSAGFKSQIVDAYRSAETASKSFTAKAQQESAKTSVALAQTGAQARNTGVQIRSLSDALSQSGGGFEQIRTIVSSFASGSNVAAGTLANALIPSIERTLTGFDKLSVSWDSQRELARVSAQASAEAASKQIENAQAARTQAQAQMATAKRSRESAQASREQAQELARFYAAQTQVNQQYGLAVSYQDEYVKINRQVREADLAEAKAKQQMATASKAVLAADVSEAAGKTQLLSSLNQISAANQKVSFSARAAAVSTGLMRSAMSLLGGPVGLGIMVAVSAAPALYTAYQRNEAEMKGFNAALMKSGNAAGMTANDLRILSTRLGGTESAVKAVTAAASAGFTGDLLSEVSSLAQQIEDVGGSADQLVSQLGSLRDDPLKAMESLTNQGIVLNDTIIQQIASLERRGQNIAASDLAQKEAAAAAQRNLDEQKKRTDEQSKSVRELGLSWRMVSVAMGDAGIAAAQIQQVKVVGENVKEQQKKADEQLKLEKKKQQQALETLRLENQLNAAYVAGKDPAKERATLTDALEKRYKAGKISTEEYTQTLKGLNKQFADKPTSSKAYQENEGAKRLQQLQEQAAVLRSQQSEADKLTDSERKLVAFKQEIASYQGKQLTAGQKSVLAMKDQLSAQLQENVSLEKANQQRQLAVKLQEQTRDAVKQTASLQLEQSNKLAEMSLSQPAYEQMLEEQKIREDFTQRRVQLEQEVTDKNSALYTQQTAFLASEQQKQLEIVRSSADERAKAEGSYSLGFRKGVSDWVTTSKNAYAQMRDLAVSSFDAMADGVATFATTGKFNFSSFATSVIADLIKIQTRMAASSLLSSLFGIGMSAAGAAAGGAASGSGGATGDMGMGTGWQNYVPNAKGGVYASPSLSAFSGQIVDRPTTFAFAKGAGLMGEAGEEAIMPLKRGADGVLGVRGTVETNQQTVSAAPQVHIHIDGTGNTATQASVGYEQFGADIGRYVDQRYRTLRDRDLRPGGTIQRAIKGR